MAICTICLDDSRKVKCRTLRSRLWWWYYNRNGKEELQLWLWFLPTRSQSKLCSWISLERGCQTEHSGFCREHDSKGWEEPGKCSWHNKGCDETSHPGVTISKTKEPDCHEDPSCGSELLLLQGKLRGRLWDLVKMLGSTLTVKKASRGEETGKSLGRD